MIKSEILNSSVRSLEKRVVGLGLANVDLIAEVEEIPGPDEHAFMLGFEKQAGGIVGNALAAVARLGVKASWIGKVGDDDNGRFIIDEMERENIDTQFVIMERRASSPFSIILTDRKTGGRSIVFNRGCSGEYGEEITDDHLESCSVLHLDGYFYDGAFSAAGRAKKLGIKVSLDAGLIFPGIEELIRLTDIFIPTREIASELTGETSVRKILEKLAANGTEIVAVTMGKEGSAGLSEEGFFFAPGFEVETVDTTAAGDTFHGAFLAGYIMGWPLNKILIFSNAVAALKCTVHGGRKGIPDFKKTMDFLKQRGITI